MLQSEPFVLVYGDNAGRMVQQYFGSYQAAVAKAEELDLSFYNIFEEFPEDPDDRLIDS